MEHKKITITSQTPVCKAKIGHPLSDNHFLIDIFRAFGILMITHWKR